MKNSRMFKILAFLTSALIFSTNSSSLIFAMPKLQKQFKGGTEFKELDENTRKFIEKRLKNIENSEKEDKKFYERNLEVFKDFKEQYCETENYEVEIYWKHGVPIVVCEHKATGAKVVFLPINNVNKDLLNSHSCAEDGGILKDYYFFRATEQNDKGIVHLAEHLLFSTEDKLKIYEEFRKNFNLGIWTDADGFFVEHMPNFSNSKEDLEKLIFKMLLKNDISKKEFEKEKRRAIIEITEKYASFKRNDISYEDFNSNYVSEGIPEEMEKSTISDVKNFLEKYKHPSNLLIIKNIYLNPSEIKRFLKSLEKNYLSHFNNKPVKITKINSKKIKHYKKINASLCDKQLDFSSSENKYMKYKAEINSLGPDEHHKEEYLKNRLDNEYLKTIRLSFLNKKRIKEIINFVKNLGYEGCSNPSLMGNITLMGNNPNLFTEKALKENYKKIFDFVSSKVENLTEEDIKLNSAIFFKYDYSNKNAPENKNSVGLNSNVLLYDNEPIVSLLKESFYETSNPISKAYFNITDKNEIKSATVKDIKNAVTRIKELNNNFNNPYIKVYEHKEIIKFTKEQLENEENYFKETFFPIKLTNFDNNIFLGYLATKFLINELNLDIAVKNGINYYDSIPTNFYDRCAAITKTPSEKVRNSVLKHIYENFKLFKENLKITEKKFEELKNKEIEFLKGMKKHSKNNKNKINEIASVINSYLKKGLNKANELNEKNGFSLTKTTTRQDLFRKVENLFTHMFHEKFEDYLEKLKLKNGFYKKYGQIEFNYKDILVDKEFVKDLKDAYITPLLKDTEKFEKDLNKAVEETNKIKFKDFKKAIESVTLVEKEQHEKDQKKCDEFLKEKLFLKI